jgi:hypothetical protein
MGVVVCQDSFEGLGTDNFGFWILDFGGLFYPSFQNLQTSSFI